LPRPVPASRVIKKVIPAQAGIQKGKNMEFNITQRRLIPSAAEGTQRINPLRQSKKRTMKALGLKTGKQYRKYIKKMRKENRESCQ